MESAGYGQNRLGSGLIPLEAVALIKAGHLKRSSSSSEPYLLRNPTKVNRMNEEALLLLLLLIVPSDSY